MNYKCRQCGLPMEGLGQRGLCSGCEILDVLPDKLADKRSLGGIPFEDMKAKDEVERIQQIVGHLKRLRGRKVLVMVDCGKDYEGKGDRYINAVREQLPAVEVVLRVLNKPAPNVESIQLKLP